MRLQPAGHRRCRRMRESSQCATRSRTLLTVRCRATAAAHTSATPRRNESPTVRPGLFARVIDRFEPARTVLFVCIVVWMRLVLPIAAVTSRAVPDVRFRPRYLRPGRVAPFATSRSVRHGARHRHVRPPHECDPARDRTAVSPRRWRRGVARGASCSRRRVAQSQCSCSGATCCKSRWCGVALADRVAAEPDVPVAHVGVLPSRCRRDRAVAVRVLGGTGTTVGMVRGRGGDRDELQGRRRPRGRHARA